MSESQISPRRVRLQGPAVKLGLALILILVLQLPLLLVSDLISERQNRQQEVVDGISRSWGPSQSLLGPTLSVPYDWIETGPQAATPLHRRSWVQIPSTSLTISATLAPETRQRGLFHATVYTARVNLSATLVVPAVQPRNAFNAPLKWDEAVVALGASDLRGQKAGTTMVINGQPVTMSVVRMTGSGGGRASAPAGLSGAVTPGTKLEVTAQLVLRGTQSFSVTPWGQQIDMKIAAPWQAPSFSGSALPLSYDITPDGFHATWDIQGDAVASNWRDDNSILPCAVFNQDSAIGVDLLEAVPTYQMVTRAAKYGTLFLVLAFLTYFLIEQSTGLRIHLAQYALLGLSVSMFALLMVAIAEPLGFNAGYAISTIAVMAQASLYTLSVTGRARSAGLLAGVLGLLFGVLYVVLRLETFALLAGTAILFTTLSVVMAATRRLDWSGAAITRG